MDYKGVENNYHCGRMSAGDNPDSEADEMVKRKLLWPISKINAFLDQAGSSDTKHE